MKILVDAMGGDNAPGAIVNGCLEAILENSDFTIVLIGDKKQIEEILSKNEYDKHRIEIVNTTEVILNCEVPTKAIKNKTDSSMVVGFNMLTEGKGQVFVSAGSSGALLAGSILIVKRIKGVERPALGSILPTKTGRVMLLDSGLNTQCKPINYVQFGQLGSAYMRSMFEIENPKVGLVNIGTEDEKGPDEVKEANELLRASEVNFVGNIEGKDILEGIVDVVVTDGFTGNVILKLIEGAASFFFGEIKGIFYKNIKTKLAALAIKSELDDFKKKMDADTNGGAPILGVNCLVIKSHGSSKAKTIKHVVLKAYNLAKSSFLDDIKDEFSNKPRRTKL